jgi:hypothetical protein
LILEEVPMESPDVECYAGASYPERPRSFNWQESTCTVDTVIKRWNSPDEQGFLVRTTDGAFFNLIYRQQEDTWRIDPQSPRTAESD